MKPPKTNRRDAGFSLAALIFFATAATILLAAAVPAYQMQARREREEELIFRGEEYVRAIQKYQRRFGVYPPTLDALEEQNGLRFIRRLYTDPTSSENKAFRLIYLNSDGSLTGSKVYSPGVSNPPQLGTPATTSSTSPAPATPARGGTPSAATPPATQTGGGQTFGTAGIIGVASDTDQTSIKVYNGRQKYNEWEFIGILSTPTTTPGGTTPIGTTPAGTTPFGTTPPLTTPPSTQPPAGGRRGP